MIDVLVLGSGVAGLSAAVRAAAAGLRAVVLTKSETGHSATRYAQGGVAAALDASDSPELHLSDTLAAGGGLCDADAVRVLVSEGPDRVRELMDAGAVFDRTGDGAAAALALAREGGHSVARVVHAGGDATGAEIERALVAALAATGVEVREGWFALDLLVEGGTCTGVAALDAAGARQVVRARHTVLASGGSGQLYSVTTNPPPSTGDGVAMALRAGVPVADLEFVQFHPTALHRDAMPRPLLSEALRGEGAILRDEGGVAFMAAEHPLADLAPRDVVARAIARRLLERGLDHLWLDATAIPAFSQRFPTIERACRDAGLDPATDWLPVAPAAHYQCGGVLTDLDGATALPGLWAVGEVACTGAHGANRLASNSLLEGLVFSARAIQAIAGRSPDTPAGPARTGALVDAAVPAPVAPAGDPDVSVLPSGSPCDAASARREVQRTMTEGAGVVRSAASLRAVQERLRTIGAPPVDDAGWHEVRNLVEVGSAVARAALAREESRGSHTREEFPDPSPRWRGRLVHVGPDDLRFTPLRRSGAPVA